MLTIQGEVNIVSKGKNMAEENYVTVPQLAHLLGVSRIAIYRRVKKGEIPARKIGGIYVISDKTIASILGHEASSKAKVRIDVAVRKTVAEYGEVLKKLGKE